MNVDLMCYGKSKFSKEMENSLQAYFTQNVGSGFWRDEVASPIARFEFFILLSFPFFYYKKKKKKP